MMAHFVNQNWPEAVKLSADHGGKFDDSVFLPYALWLRDKGSFDEALEAFRKAGRRDLSGAMTAQLMYVLPPPPPGRRSTFRVLHVYYNS